MIRWDKEEILSRLFAGLKITLFLIGLFFILFNLISLVYPSSSKENNNLKMVSGTEYISGEQGQVIVRLENAKNQGITDANCILSLLYPDKSYFLIDQQMIATSVPGNYYFSFLTPQREGIYEEQIICSSEDAKFVNRYISSSFHVSTGLNLILEISKTQREQYNDLNSKLMELENKLGDFDKNIGDKIANLEMSNKEISENVTLVNDKINNLDANIDSKLNDKFNNLNSKFKQTAESMAQIFTN